MKSLRELYRIGHGPSSSHTMAPMRAMARFLEKVGVRPASIRVTLYGSLEFLSDALEISLQYKISIYDSLYLALALKKRARLLTLDERQADVAKRLGIEVLP